MSNLPTTELNPLRRLQVLAASMPGATYDEAIVHAPSEQVWGLVSDMDTSMPLLFANFRSWRTIEHHGEHLRAVAVGHLGLRGVFEITLKPGICIMQDRRFVGGLAAMPNVGGTRFALFAAPRGVARHLGVLIRPVGRRVLRHSVHRLDAHITTTNR